MANPRPRLLVTGGDHAFPVPEPLGRAIPLTPLTGPEARVFASLLWFAWFREVWQKWDPKAGDPQTFTTPGEIAYTAGFGGSRGNREVWTGLQGLSEKRLLVDYESKPILAFERTENNFVQIAFASKIGDIYMHRDHLTYGLMDIRHFAALKKGLDYHLYNRLMLVAQQQWPSIDMGLEEICAVTGASWSTGRTWQRLKPVVLGSIARIAAVTSAKIGIEVSHSGRRPEIDRVKMLIRHTSETSSTLMHGRRPYAQSWEVTAGGIRETTQPRRSFEKPVGRPA